MKKEEMCQLPVLDNQFRFVGGTNGGLILN